MRKRFRDFSEEDSEHDFDASTVKDKDLDDLDILHQFLIGGKAFAKLRTEIEAYVAPKTLRSTDSDFVISA